MDGWIGYDFPFIIISCSMGQSLINCHSGNTATASTKQSGLVFCLPSKAFCYFSESSSRGKHDT